MDMTTNMQNGGADSRRIVRGTSPNEDKILAIFEKLNDKDNRVRIYYGDKQKTYIISKEKFSAMKKQPRSIPYMLIKRDVDDKDLKLLDCKEQYDVIYKESVMLKELTGGKMNRFRTGSVAKTGIQLWYDLCNPEIQDDIDDKEADILEKCPRGALTYGIKYEGVGYKYDVCSEYPAVMIAKTLKMPYGKPIYENMTSTEFDALPFYKYGIYHVIVHNSDKRVFRHNSKNWYTHTDLNYAKNHLHYKLEIVEDGEDNAMIYPKLKLVRTMFKAYIDYLFPFKKQGVKEIKKYINVLWGALCQKNDMVVPMSKTFETDNIVMTMPLFNDAIENYDMSFHLATIAKTGKRYETNYARIEPFIVASGRLKISNMILPNINKVVRCHTDGIILKEPIEHITLGDDIGDLKFEESGPCKILNCNDFMFNGEIHGRKKSFL